jgi:hypothetical protein
MTGATFVVGIYVAFVVIAGWILLVPYIRAKRRPPVPGERWYFREPKGDPWQRDAHAVEILDVKRGWVRYSIGRYFADNRMKLTTFVYIYRPEEQA